MPFPVPLVLGEIIWLKRLFLVLKLHIKDFPQNFFFNTFSQQSLQKFLQCTLKYGRLLARCLVISHTEWMKHLVFWWDPPYKTPPPGLHTCLLPCFPGLDLHKPARYHYLFKSWVLLNSSSINSIWRSDAIARRKWKCKLVCYVASNHKTINDC